ncbi:MAG: S1 RNA-binding domain-containing protein, partial [Deltaproteobacteria bacterium]|nr:S1 RNA-binding domain-containing protein [Deltaproteobacteria bacterium]
MTVKDENEKQNLEPDSVFSAGEHDADEEMDSMHDLYEQSFRNFQEGEVVRGRIVQVSDDFVMVDIGYKSEGQIPIYEFRDETGKVKAVIGDEIDVLLEFHDDDDGSIHLSKEKAAKIKVWDDISRIYSDDGIIEGKVTAKVKGGLAVDIGVQAFLPGSQVDLRPVRNLESLIGHIFAFKVLKYNKKRRNVVLSRRALLEKEREQMKSTTLSALEDNKVVEGIVKNITDYGVFVDLGGIDGLLHITDMSWGRVGHPSEMFQIGDKIQVKVLSFDRETERVSLGLKQLVSTKTAPCA